MDGDGGGSHVKKFPRRAKRGQIGMIIMSSIRKDFK